MSMNQPKGKNANPMLDALLSSPPAMSPAPGGQGMGGSTDLTAEVAAVQDALTAIQDDPTSGFDSLDSAVAALKAKAGV